MSINWADDEADHERLSLDHDRDLPAMADVIDIDGRRDPNTRTCNGAWTKHDRAAWLACPFCGGAA